MACKDDGPEIGQRKKYKKSVYTVPFCTNIDCFNHRAGKLKEYTCFTNLYKIYGQSFHIIGENRVYKVNIPDPVNCPECARMLFPYVRLDEKIYLVAVNEATLIKPIADIHCPGYYKLISVSIYQITRLGPVLVIDDFILLVNGQLDPPNYEAIDANGYFKASFSKFRVNGELCSLFMQEKSIFVPGPLLMLIVGETGTVVQYTALKQVGKFIFSDSVHTICTKTATYRHVDDMELTEPAPTKVAKKAAKKAELIHI